MTPQLPPLSILDLAIIRRNQSVGEALAATVDMAQLAQRRGYRRVWYAEHHNMAGIGSSATSVLIAHVAAHTSHIRLGAGGIMLPNHSPLVIAEQFGTLEALHPGRIDLGLGRAPGSDRKTMVALRRDPASSDRFPQDVEELQGYLSGNSVIPGVDAVPGKGSAVPLYILGSSMFGANLAAAMGLPYAFASHFAPEALVPAVAHYRRNFQPSDQLSDPHVIAGVNVIASDSDGDAGQQLTEVRRARLARFTRPGITLTDDQADEILASQQGQPIADMMRYTAAGSPETVANFLHQFAQEAQADELMVSHASRSVDQRLRSADLLADVAGLDPGPPI